MILCRGLGVPLRVRPGTGPLLGSARLVLRRSCLCSVPSRIGLGHGSVESVVRSFTIFRNKSLEHIFFAGEQKNQCDNFFLKIFFDDHQKKPRKNMKSSELFLAQFSRKIIMCSRFLVVS